MAGNTPKTDKIISRSDYLRNSEEVQTWCRLGHFADNTSMNYVQGLHKYCKLHEMTPDELLNEACLLYTSPSPRDRS